MYLEYYGLKEAPFSITPDPRYVFLSERHRDALAHLLYGVGKGGSGGFVQLTGEVGTGKTTLCRLLLEQLPEHTRVALVLNPKLTPIELLETICEELKLDIGERRGSLKGLVDTLNAYLLDAYAQGLRVAGAAKLPFSRLGLRALYQRSGGVPRLINIIADRALMAGFAREQDSLGERLVDRAADETLPGHARYWMRHYGRWAAAALLLVGAGMALNWYQNREPEKPVQAAVPAPPPVPPPPDADEVAAKRLDAALQGNGESELAAWTQLLARWQVKSSDVAVHEAARCQNIIFPGLNCLRGHASLEQLARFDRPLILSLQRNGAHGYALMQGVAGNRITLSFVGDIVNLSTDKLRDFWNGDFVAIWRQPEQVPATLRVGDAGTGVVWVKSQVARMVGAKAADAGPAYFDTTLEERIRKLQVAYGIHPDGIVGPETLFALSALDESGPHLAREVNL
jgi:general secretion pathway protein A